MCRFCYLGDRFITSGDCEVELETGPIVRLEPDIYFVARLMPEI